jgi:hypothetical protein
MKQEHDQYRLAFGHINLIDDDDDDDDDKLVFSLTGSSL